MELIAISLLRFCRKGILIVMMKYEFNEPKVGRSPRCAVLTERRPEDELQEMPLPSNSGSQLHVIAPDSNI